MGAPDVERPPHEPRSEPVENNWVVKNRFEFVRLPATLEQTSKRLRKMAE